MSLCPHGACREQETDVTPTQMLGKKRSWGENGVEGWCPRRLFLPRNCQGSRGFKYEYGLSRQGWRVLRSLPTPCPHASNRCLPGPPCQTCFPLQGGVTVTFVQLSPAGFIYDPFLACFISLQHPPPTHPAHHLDAHRDKPAILREQRLTESEPYHSAYTLLSSALGQAS